MQSNESKDAERRRRERYQLNLPVQTQLNGNGYYNIEMIDISTTGIQIRSKNVDLFKGKGYMRNRQDRLKIVVEARLAWAEPEAGGGLLTGWEFVPEAGNVKVDSAGHE